MFSHCCKKFNFNAIHTLPHRDYAHYSSYQLMHIDFEFLTQFFSTNGYPKSLVHSMINPFVNNRLTKGCPVLTIRKKNSLFCLAPLSTYFSANENQCLQPNRRILSQFDPQIILVNKFKIVFFFSITKPLYRVLPDRV